MNYVKYKKEDIAKKDFTVEFKGYKVEEVDLFLDEITRDYEILEFEKQKMRDKVISLEHENQNLLDENEKIIASLQLSQQQLEKLARSGVNSSSILKRIANLEKQNLGQK
ncbi:DivIVA domain-containing protein [Spiroplasma sabaudiense Ar-1343]|uniref:DivIVA domain-containing protein n=1 Tax=Spiroplasma sabaudiense Ar-1343 TaxID=1276257 RepID=W6A9Y4_9MOLU|nr:DivIVA domain-containing protein [Spiroplasma sabaudiense]AHI53670.1 DivIVA domain-containing protein [Spiroplasma sabaudiense Ar-1343]